MGVVCRFGGFTFPCTPEEFLIQDGSEFVTYQITETGEHAFPRGRKAQRVSWASWMPGRDYEGTQAPFMVGSWQDPLAFFAWLRSLIDDGEAGKRVLTIGEAADPSATGTHLSQVMYLSTLTVKPGGRDFYYAVEFVESRDFSFDKQTSRARSSRALATSHAARAGETLFTAAARVWGDTARWRDLRAANPAFAGFSPADPLPVGAVLVVPGTG